MRLLSAQGCGLRKITRSPKIANHAILGAQHLNLYEKSVFPVAQRQKLVACGTQALLEHSPATLVDHHELYCRVRQAKSKQER